MSFKHAQRITIQILFFFFTLHVHSVLKAKSINGNQQKPASQGLVEYHLAHCGKNCNEVQYKNTLTCAYLGYIQKEQVPHVETLIPPCSCRHGSTIMLVID